MEPTITKSVTLTQRQWAYIMELAKAEKDAMMSDAQAYEAEGDDEQAEESRDSNAQASAIVCALAIARDA